MKKYKVIYDPSTMIGSFEIEAEDMIDKDNCIKLIKKNQGLAYDTIASLPKSCIVYEITNGVTDGLSNEKISSLQQKMGELSSLAKLLKEMEESLVNISKMH